MDINWTLVLGILLALVSLALFMAYAYRAGYDDAVEDEEAWWDEHEGEEVPQRTGEVVDGIAWPDPEPGESITLDVQNVIQDGKGGGLGG